MSDECLTVQQLIELLSKFPPDAVVYMYEGGVHSVRLEEGGWVFMETGLEGTP